MMTSNPSGEEFIKEEKSKEEKSLPMPRLTLLFELDLRQVKVERFSDKAHEGNCTSVIYEAGLYYTWAALIFSTETEGTNEVWEG